MAHLLRHDGEREAVFGVVHEFPHSLLGVAVAQAVGAPVFPSASTLARENDALNACPPPRS